MTITKHRDGSAWRISVDGRATSLIIEKGSAPKYRDPQMYDVSAGDEWLFEAKSVHSAMSIISTIREA